MPELLSRIGDSSVRSTRLGLLRQFTETGSNLIAAGVSSIAYARRFRQLIDAIQPSLVFSNGLKFHAISGLAGSGQARLVWFMHDYLVSRALMRRLLPWISGSVGLVLSNSQSVADDVGCVLRRVRREVVYCGIDRCHFAPGSVDATRLDHLAGCPPLTKGGVRVGIVATYARWKGQDLFLEAAARVMRQRPSVPIRFYIIGGPIYSTRGSQFTELELRRLALEQGIAEHLGFVPFQDDTADIYRSLDVVVHASRHPEPFGRTILEAMSCGRAVVATRAGGAAEIFNGGENAIGFPIGDVAELSTAIAELISDPVRRDELGCRARETTAAFSRSIMGERLQKCLLEL
jgi:glycosyltransferase involved in cell wall biosynthesis